MARKVFFSFHYSRDSHRVSQIRECNSVSQHFTLTPFLTKSKWEEIKLEGRKAIENWIEENMRGTSVVVVCYGRETATRPWVRYELEKAHREGRGILAIDMSGMKNLQQAVDYIGINPLTTASDANKRPLSNFAQYRTYHWNHDDGRNNIDEWIEQAAQLVNR
ncbi:TIR domain-containing protein [Hymenobacter arizonensis]|uniref:MTH538 TIR-like domain n=1 Tax=Hymenobacter arizonensis TaxID=1227077 RepID=A0A1I6BG49_HYMAR|nr:TIR domain-containing protein [Hymenobacter arizonensis]SFQ79905.1 MTH538 TIR-like domain [Hymenobacter arizonensis]